MSTQDGGWFGPKRFGWGISPRTWQGWATLAVYIALLIALPRFVSPKTEHVWFLACVGLLTVILVAVAIWKSGRSKSP